MNSVLWVSSWFCLATDQIAQTGLSSLPPLIYYSEQLFSQLGDELPVEHFLLDDDSANRPTEFEVVFIDGGVRYVYGFSATKRKVYNEWLLAYPYGRAQIWIMREWDESAHDYYWSGASKLQGKKKLWQDSTRPNSLFLSTAVQLNSKQLTSIYDWFRCKLKIINVHGVFQSFSAELCGVKDKQAELVKFIKAADLGIDDIVVKEEELSLRHLPEFIPEEDRVKLLKDLKGEKHYEINVKHISNSGRVIDFDISEESDGTQKLFSFAGPWLDVLENGYVLFVDELNNSLHPNIVKFLVSMFHSSSLNKKNAQLVFTTHESSILSQDVFRRDQVWFAEKDQAQATQIYPLSDFSPRKNVNLENAYLEGRYGAVPFVDFEFLG